MAVSDEDMTIVLMRPNFRCMIGPYILARVDRDLWGWSPSLCKFPMTGKGTGPGGSSLALVPANLASQMRALKMVNANNRENSMVKISMLVSSVSELSQLCSC